LRIFLEQFLPDICDDRQAVTDIETEGTFKQTNLRRCPVRRQSGSRREK
jgi:hypothetical protein